MQVQIKDPEHILVCEICGSPEIQMHAWADVNTHEFIEWVDPYQPEYYCMVCQTETTIISMSEYNETEKEPPCTK